MTKYSFYVDKSVKNKDNKFIDIKLDRPIICYDNEYATIKIKDIMYLNNMYNVSSFLQNNIFNLVRKSLTYDITNVTTLPNTEILLNIKNSIHDTTTGTLPYYREGTTTSWDMTNKIFKIENSEYAISYYTPFLINNLDPFGVYASDNSFTAYNYVFNTTDINNRISVLYDEYIILNFKQTKTLIKKVSYGMFYNGQVSSAFTATFDLVLQGSNDGINYTTIPFNAGTLSQIMFSYGASQGAYFRNNLFLNNSIVYDYIKISISSTGASSLKNYFKLNSVILYRVDYTLDGTISPTTTTNITIPDGFYRVSNYITTINTLLEPYNIEMTFNNITNKLSLTNNNTSISSPQYGDVDEFFICSLQLPTKYIQNNMGFKDEYNALSKTLTITADTNIDLVNFKKLILTTNMDLENKTHNELTGANTDETGIGNILVWLDSDEPPLTCIKYKNIENTSYKLQNKEINNLIFYLYNEKKQQINLDNMLIHFEIEKNNYRY